MPKKQKLPTRPYTMQRYGIQNPYGEIWSVNTFETMDEAKKYVRDFWRGVPGEDQIEKFNVIPVTVTIAAVT